MSMSRFLDDFSASFMNSLLLDMEVLVTGDLSQLVTQPTMTTDTSMTLTDFALTSNKSFIACCDVIISAVADHCWWRSH